MQERDQLQRDFLQVLGDPGVPVELVGNSLLQGLGGLGLAMDPDPIRRLREASEPAQNLSVVGMAAQVLHRLDAGADGDGLSMSLQGRRSFSEGQFAPRSLSSAGGFQQAYNG